MFSLIAQVRSSSAPWSPAFALVRPSRLRSWPSGTNSSFSNARDTLACRSRAGTEPSGPWSSCRWSGWKHSLVLVKPETVIAWHRRTFRLVWRWKSRGGRPSTRAHIRRLIGQMARENPTWGAPRIHGELLKLGYAVGQRTVSRYLARIRPESTKARSQTWTAFLKNHARDRAYGVAFSQRVKNLGIREIRTAVRAPMMNAFAERLIGTLRRECFDHVIVLTEQHARRLLGEFRDWYNQDRVHLALGKDAPDHRSVEPPELGKVVALPRVDGFASSLFPSRCLRLGPPNPRHVAVGDSRRRCVRERRGTAPADPERSSSTAFPAVSAQFTPVASPVQPTLALWRTTPVARPRRAHERGEDRERRLPRAGRTCRPRPRELLREAGQEPGGTRDQTSRSRSWPWRSFAVSRHRASPMARRSA